MKINKLLRQKVNLFSAALLSLGIIIAPASVFAATAKPRIPTSFASEAACVKKLSTYELADLRTYGQKRTDNRLVTIDKKLRDKIASKTPKNQKVADQLNGENEFYREATGRDGTTPSESTDSPIDSTGDLNKEVDAARQFVVTNVGLIQRDDKTSQDAAGHICAVIYQGNVYGYLYYKITYFHDLDNVSNINSINKEELGFIKDKSPKLKKAPKSVAKLPKTITSETFTKNANTAVAIQGDIKDINKKDFKTSDFKKVKADYHTLSTKVHGEYKSLHSIYKAVRTQCIKEKKCEGKLPAQSGSTTNPTGEQPHESGGQ